MDQTSRQLLYLLSVSMGTDLDTIINTVEVEWDKLFFLSGIHNVIPMIYHAINKKQLLPMINPELAVVWKKLAVGYTVDQIIRTKEFLAIYTKLKQAGINALVVKGIVFRKLYPNSDERCSGDEDIYIHREDFSKVASVLIDSGFELSELSGKEKAPRQETIYVSRKTGLILEVHVDLFDPGIGLFKAMNDQFETAFERSIEIIVEGIPIHTLSYSDHLLFQILHCTKHFVGMGFGIRQLCDLVMFCNTYGNMVDYPWVWQQVTSLGYDIFLLNLLAIGSKYLGLSDQYRWYPHQAVLMDIHSDALLEDMICAGAYGRSDEDRIRTCSLTLQAVIADRGFRLKKYYKKQTLKIFFPDHEFMNNRYPYCRNNPFLLPLAWLHRIASYAVQVKNPIQMVQKANRSIAIGRRRIQLLKEYKMIGL